MHTSLTAVWWRRRVVLQRQGSEVGRHNVGTVVVRTSAAVLSAAAVAAKRFIPCVLRDELCYERSKKKCNEINESIALVLSTTRPAATAILFDRVNNKQPVSSASLSKGV
jgi:hypothetical protein